MKKTILITSGIFILLLVLLVWIYLMLYGTPNDGGEVFANLGFEPATQNVTITEPMIPTTVTEIENLVDTNSTQALRQLTTKPVAGFISLTSSTSNTVRYVERGTGHIYAINLATGQETQISRTTVPQVSEAVFAKSGEVVTLTSYSGYIPTTIVGNINDEGTLSSIDLEPNATDFHFVSDSKLRYTVTLSDATVGYEHDLTLGTRRELFRFNYTNLDTLWGTAADTPIIATKPARNLKGFMYEISGNTVTPVIPSAYGLTGFMNDRWFILTLTENNQYYFIARNRSTDENIELPIPTLKEKCTFDMAASLYLWCAAPATLSSNTFVEDWYKGTERSNDYLWLVDINSATAELVANPERLSGRSIDIKDINISPDGQNLFFLNKDDRSLWQFDLVTEAE